MRKPGIIVLLALLFFSCVGFGWFQKRISEAELTSLDTAANTVVVANDSKSVLGHIASADGNHKALAGKDISVLIRHAHMAAEDRAFYTHGGISLWGIARAMVTNLLNGEVVAGGSTITQQYAKKFAGSEQTGERKVNEAIYARLIEKELTKDEILERYVNANFYGRGAYGIEDASQTWFGVSATQLGKMDDPLQVARAAFLAALIKAPSPYSKYDGKPSNLVNAEEVWDRTRYVLDGLRKLEGLPSGPDGKPAAMVSQTIIDQAKSKLPLKLTETVKNTGNTVDGDPALMHYLRDWLAEWQTELAKKDGLKGDDASKAGHTAAEEMLARGGLKFTLSIDAKLQPMAVKAHKDRMSSNASAVVVLNPRDGAVLALSSGRNYSADQFNYAIYGQRPPGSTVKPFILADAVKNGVSVNSEFAAPGEITVDGPPIGNHGSGDDPDCKMTLADALAFSHNIVFVQAAMGKMTSCQDRTKVAPIANYPVTPKSVAKLLRESGAQASLVPGREDPVEIGEEPRLGIGSTLKLSPLKLAVMGATLADRGMYHKPYLIAKIEGPKGEIFKHEDQSRRVLEEKHADIVNQAMVGVYTKGTAKDAQVPPHPVGGKTGTTDTEEGDSWFVGYNAVNPKNKKAPAYLCLAHEGKNPKHGGADAAKVCQHFFSNALKGKPKVDFVGADPKGGKLVGLSVDLPPSPPASKQPESAKPSPSPSRRPSPSNSPSPVRPSLPVPSKSITATLPVPGIGWR